jgi:pyruvate kinase
MIEKQILVTLGPSSLSKNIVQSCEKEGANLFRINLSHTKLELVEPIIKTIQEWTDVPICLDSEGAQIRNEMVSGDRVFFSEGSIVKIHNNEILGDENNISFTPRNIAHQFVVGDSIRIDFDSVQFKVIEQADDYCSAIVETGGYIGSNKAVDLNRKIDLEPVTQKDKSAIVIGRQMGITNYALSFTQCSEDIDIMRSLIGYESNLICKIESRSGVLNLDEILNNADQILIDRGDLSRQIPLYKIPFMQRRIISLARSKDTPVFVATNLLESMITSRNPSRAEVNDVVSTLIMGASGLVLAAETAIGKFPVDAVKNARKLIQQFEKWTTNTSIKEILDN